MSTICVVFNQTSHFFDLVTGAVTGPGTPGTPVVLNGSGVIDPTLIGGGGGPGINIAKLTFHDTDILNMEIDGSGGLILLAGVANKIFIPISCVLRFVYGNVALFGGTAFDDLLLNQADGNAIMLGSTKFLLDGGQGNSVIEIMHARDQATAVLISPLAGSQPLILATNDTPLTGGDPGGNTNVLTVTVGYYIYDTVTGLLS